MTAPTSEADFERARRAVAYGWTTESAVERALASADAAPPSEEAPITSHLPLSSAQRRALLGPLLPPEAAEALRAPGRAAGRYALVSELGAGGMGRVYRAWDTTLGRWVALKLLRRVEDSRGRALFEREARLAGSLGIAGVPAVFEMGEHEGAPFLAMQLIDGATPGARGERLPPRRAAQVVRDAARVVDEAHRRGIVHRDLKPANLMVDRAGRVFVMDFGLARLLEDDAGAAGSTLTGEIVGTPEYMSPEQASGRRLAVGPASDVYSLGACLFELLLGRPPFVARDRGALIAEVLRDAPPRPREVLPSTPAGLEAIALRCLEKDAAARPGSAGALARALDRWLAGGDRAVAAMLPAPPRSRAGLAIGGALAAAVLLAAYAAAQRPEGGGGRAALAGEGIVSRRAPVLVLRDERMKDIESVVLDGERIYVSAVEKPEDPPRFALYSFPREGPARPARLYEYFEGAFGLGVVGGDIFWTHANSGEPEMASQVFRAPKDGSGRERVIHTGKPSDHLIADASGLAAFGGRLYVVDEVGGRVTRFETDGSRPLCLAPPRYPGGFEVEHHHGIAADASGIYVVDAGQKGVAKPAVLSIPLEGGPFRVLHEGLPLIRPYNVAVTRGGVYVVDPGANAVFVVPREGGEPQVVWAGPPFLELRAIAASPGGDAIYIADDGNVEATRGGRVDEPGALFRIDLDAGR